MIQPFLILSTRSCLPYTKRVVAELNNNPERILFPETIDFTNELSVLEFADGELEVTLNRSVRGKTVFLFTTSAKNEAGLSVEECKIELYHAIDVLRRSQALKIIVFEPYMSCSRSDRTTRRNSVGLWIHYKTMISLGASHFITFQLHSDKSKTVFDPCLCASDDVPAMSLLQKYLCDTTIKNRLEMDTTVRNTWLFCSVDAGGEKLAKRYAASFGTQLIIAHKQRNYCEANTIDSISLLSAVPLENKTVWIVDDMIDTAGSIYGLVKELSTRNCREVNVIIVHPILSGPAVDRILELKNKGILGRLIACDTVSCSSVIEKLPFLEIVSSANLSSKVVLTITQDRPMADLTDTFLPADYLPS